MTPTQGCLWDDRVWLRMDFHVRTASIRLGTAKPIAAVRWATKPRLIGEVRPHQQGPG
ncbi:MAG: hypothetical protein QOD93_76 [Acetobacteraceae bacterium]|jgi:hypothetical protein|nr:hypothetical protein [Acetobacteraceae bacterium]